jgi:hypothetical protein
MKVLNFANPERVYVLKLVEKRPESILNYSSILKKSYFYNIFFWIDVFKSKVSYDLDDNWLNYGTFVSNGHLEFLRHFQNSYFFFLWSRLPKYFIKPTRNSSFLQLLFHYYKLALPSVSLKGLKVNSESQKKTLMTSTVRQ